MTPKAGDTTCCIQEMRINEEPTCGEQLLKTELSTLLHI